MRSAAQYVHAAAGSVEMAECGPLGGDAVCWQCGGDAERGAPLVEWLGETHGAYTRAAAPSSVWICEACVFVSSRVSPVPGRPPAPGKQFGGNYRNYSHLIEASPTVGYANASKGEKDIVRAFVLRAHQHPWAAAIADSGQKHVLPFAPMNPASDGRGVVAFDDRMVRIPPAEQAAMLVEAMSDLLTAGATKEDIETGAWSDRAWQIEAPGGGLAVHAFEGQHGHLRGGSWFALAVWLAQRDEAAVQARMEAERTSRALARGRKGRDDGSQAGDDGRTSGSGGAGARRAETGRAAGGPVAAEAVRPDRDADAGVGATAEAAQDAARDNFDRTREAPEIDEWQYASDGDENTVYLISCTQALVDAVSAQGGSVGFRIVGRGSRAVATA